MKQIKIKLTLLPLFLVFTLMVQPLSAQETYSGKKNGSLEAAGIDQFHISLDNGFTVHIRGTETDQITYAYTFTGNRLSHEQKLANANFRLEQQGSTALLQVRFPALEDLERENRSWLQKLFGSGQWNTYTETQELIINMPRDLAITFSSRYSDVDLADIYRNVTLSNRSGTIIANNLAGNLEVENQYGNTTARNIGGNVRIESRSADVKLENINGSVRINSLYSDLTLANIGDNVEIQTQSGTLDVQAIGGTLTAQGDYTSMEISEIEGHVQVRSRSGDLIISDIPSLEFNGEYTDIEATDITGTDGIHIQGKSSTINLRNIRGRTQISGEYLEISVENIRENLSISNRSGSITADHIEGAARINGEYNEISLDHFLGSRLVIENRSDDVSVESTGTLSEVNIRVEYGSVHLTLENEFSGEYSLEARYGKLDTNIFPMDNIDSRSSHQSISGILGENPNNHFHIRTRNGDISVQKQ